MKRVWRARIGVANLDNVPVQPEAHQEANTGQIAAALLEWIIACEAWHASTRRALRNGLPAWYRFHAPWRNSAIVAWDNRKWALVRKTTFVLHGSFKFWDTRRAAAVLLQQRNGDRCVWVVAVHLAPPATKRGDEAQEAARDAHRLALQRITDFARKTGFPVVFAGDWNMTGRFLGNEIYGRSIAYSGTGEIDAWISIDGKNVELNASSHIPFRLPHSGHKYGQAGYVTAWTR